MAESGPEPSSPEPNTVRSTSPLSLSPTSRRTVHLHLWHVKQCRWRNRTKDLRYMTFQFLTLLSSIQAKSVPMALIQSPWLKGALDWKRELIPADVIFQMKEWKPKEGKCFSPCSLRKCYSGKMLLSFHFAVLSHRLEKFTKHRKFQQELREKRTVSWKLGRKKNPSSKNYGKRILKQT